MRYWTNNVEYGVARHGEMRMASKKLRGCSEERYAEGWWRKDDAPEK